MIWPYGIWPGLTCVIVEIETDEGLVGIGESAVLFKPVEAIIAHLRAFESYLVDEDPFDVERISKKLRLLGGWQYSRVYGNYALSGVDTALWDIKGKACGRPLYKLLGGAVREQIPVIKYLIKDAPEVMAQVARDAVTDGYETLYMKFTTIPELIDAIVAVREAVGYQPKLRIDFNQTLSPGYAVKLISDLEKYNIEFIEQPVLADDLDGLKYVRDSVRVPIAADEACHNLYDTFQVIKKGAADIIHVDPRTHDGILDAKKAAGIAEAAGLPVVLHSTTEAGIAQSMFLHVAASTPNFILANQSIYDNLADDYIRPGALRIKQGYMSVPQGPGVGVELDPEKVGKYHELFKEFGTYTTFGLKTEELPKASLRVLPSY